MRICRYLKNDSIQIGIVNDQDLVMCIHDAARSSEIDLPPVDSLLDLLPGGAEAERAREIASQLTSESFAEFGEPLDSLRLFTPIPSPGKLLLLAGNYAKHVIERGGQAEERQRTFPYVFMKPTSTLTNPGDPIRIPRISPDEIDWEVELGVIIGKRCRHVSEEDALTFVAGYTVVNDISDRAFRPNPGRTKRDRDAFFDWQHGKWHDTFCPMGPAVLSADACPDPQSLSLKLRVNGSLEQDGSTAEMVFPVAAIVSFLSQMMTLEPGDIISTGTPDGVGKAKGKFLRPGDVVEAEIGKIGVLRNSVVAK